MKKVQKQPTRNPKPRVHYVLWNRELPFAPKTQQNRVLYKRHSKHRAQDTVG